MPLPLQQAGSHEEGLPSGRSLGKRGDPAEKITNKSRFVCDQHEGGPVPVPTDGATAHVGHAMRSDPSSVASADHGRANVLDQRTCWTAFASRAIAHQTEAANRPCTIF